MGKEILRGFVRMKKLNVGCGRDIRKGWVNLDGVKFEGIDVVHNLDKFPYPFKDNTFEEVWAQQIIEHLDHPQEFVKELWRISKPGAKVVIGTVHFSSPCVWGDITHKRPYQSDSLNWCNIKYKKSKNFSLVNSGNEFFIVKSSIHFRYFFKPLKYLVNINRYTQLIYERWFSAFFRADGQRYDLIVLKPKGKRLK
jgi:SAM-dependent methyltransferase